MLIFSFSDLGDSYNPLPLGVTDGSCQPKHLESQMFPTEEQTFLKSNENCPYCPALKE